MVHPNMPPGTVLFLSDSVPYALNNITNVLQIRTRRDCYQTEWPPHAGLRVRRLHRPGAAELLHAGHVRPCQPVRGVSRGHTEWTQTGAGERSSAPLFAHLRVIALLQMTPDLAQEAP